MKKMLLVCLAVLVIAFGNSSRAAAQVEATVVKVPFSFIAGQRLMPAGSYRIAPTAADWSVVSVTNIDGKNAAAAVVQTLAENGGEPYHGEARVKFVPYGGQAFLQEIAVPGRDPRQVVLNQAYAEQTLVKLNLMNAEPAIPAK